MPDKKSVYIDIYHSLFDDDGLTTKDLAHLYKMNITTDIDIGKIVNQVKLLIFKQYGDGLYIKAEEFEDFCYLNIVIMFGKEYNFIAEYLESINMSQEMNLNTLVNPKFFLSVDYFFSQQETAELQEILHDFGIDTKVYFIERKAFERGAGDYHENVVLSLITGSAQAIGSRVTNYLIDKFSDHQNARINSVNTDTILGHISKETGINKQDLHLTKTKNISDEKIEIIITNRYKNIKVLYDKNSNSISYEVSHKTQTMI